MEPGLWGSDEGGLVSRGGSGMVSDMSAASSLQMSFGWCLCQVRRGGNPALWEGCVWVEPEPRKAGPGALLPERGDHGPLASRLAPGNA